VIMNKSRKLFNFSQTTPTVGGSTGRRCVLLHVDPVKTEAACGTLITAFEKKAACIREE